MSSRLVTNGSGRKKNTENVKYKQQTCWKSHKKNDRWNGLCVTVFVNTYISTYFYVWCFFSLLFFLQFSFEAAQHLFCFRFGKCISVRFNIFFSRFCSLYAIQLDSTVIGFFFLLYYPILGQQANATK